MRILILWIGLAVVWIFNAWTTPRTWTTGELITAAIMNTHIRDNLNVLKAPPSDNYEVNEVSDYTTTSTSFIDVDGTNLSFTFTTSGGDVMVHFHAALLAAAGNQIYFNVDIDGSPHAADDGIIAVEDESGVSDADQNVTFTRLIIGLSAASHTFKLQWKVDAGTATLYAGAGTSEKDLHPQFWAREVS